MPVCQPRDLDGKLDSSCEEILCFAARCSICTARVVPSKRWIIPACKCDILRRSKLAASYIRIPYILWSLVQYDHSAPFSLHLRLFSFPFQYRILVATNLASHFGKFCTHADAKVMEGGNSSCFEKATVWKEEIVNAPRRTYQPLVVAKTTTVTQSNHITIASAPPLS